MFAEAVYRAAQLAHDSKAPGVPVLFTWASRGKATAYVYDLNSATAARDGLEHTLRLLLRSNAEKVNVLAHSMGNWVTVEAFRQIRISGDLPPASKIGNDLLAAPDIDIDVFKSQLRRFGKPQKPFYVVLSQDDRALFLSRTIAGGVTRVGDSADTAELTALGATVIDLTDVKGDRSHQSRQIRPARCRRAPAARRSRPGHKRKSSSERCERKSGERRRLSRCVAAHPARRADQDHRRPVGCEGEVPSRHCERSEACVDGPSLARSGGGFFGRAFACVHVSGLLMQPRLLAKMASAGGRSKQSSDLDRPLLRAVYLPLRIERSRPSSFLLQARQRRARMSFRTRRSRQAAAIALPPACA